MITHSAGGRAERMQVGEFIKHFPTPNIQRVGRKSEGKPSVKSGAGALQGAYWVLGARDF